MKYTANIDIMPQSDIMNPEGEIIAQTLEQLNILQVKKIAIGKRISISFSADSETSAIQIVKKACESLLVNPLTETYAFQITPDQIKDEEE